MNPPANGLTMEFGKRDVRKSPGVQSLPVRPPSGSSPERVPRENALDRPVKSKAIAVMLPVVAGGIFLALLSLWIVRHLAG